MEARLRRVAVVGWLVALLSLRAFVPSTTLRAAACSTIPTAGLEPRVVSGGRYLLSVPPGLTAAAPLLLSLHGAYLTAEQEAVTTQWHVHAKGYIVAYPQTPAGVAWAWTGPGREHDVRFLRAVIGDISARYCVDPDRVHVTGLSSGGGMSQRMACDAADVVASVGAVSANAVTLCDPVRPLGVALFHGTDDELVSVHHSAIGRDLWGERLGCAHRQEESLPDGELVRLTGCARGVEVLWRSYNGEDHIGPTLKKQDDLRRRHLQFFASHSR